MKKIKYGLNRTLRGSLEIELKDIIDEYSLDIPRTQFYNPRIYNGQRILISEENNSRLILDWFDELRLLFLHSIAFTIKYWSGLPEDLLRRIEELKPSLYSKSYESDYIEMQLNSLAQEIENSNLCMKKQLLFRWFVVTNIYKIGG